LLCLLRRCEALLSRALSSLSCKLNNQASVVITAAPRRQ
jgi:hypothetical protein